MRGWLAIGLVLVLLLSGCTQKSDPSSSTTGATSTPAASANHAPTATLAAKAGNGTASLNATFALGGSDPDGDALHWSLSFGDNSSSAQGDALPANATHAYAKAGTYNVTLLVSDGRESTTQTASVNVTAPGAPLEEAGFLPVNETKAWLVSYAGAFEYAAGCKADGEDCAYFDLAAGAPGRTFTMTFTATAPAAVYFIDYYNGDHYIDSFIGEPGATSITGEVPADTTQFRAYATGGADFTAHLVIE
ncbi:MAG: PKD domain-containing protein [Halobacteriales archaeon]|nr:PKD domain-containing protein [Halobacteriales archaeon]